MLSTPLYHNPENHKLLLKTCMTVFTMKSHFYYCAKIKIKIKIYTLWGSPKWIKQWKVNESIVRWIIRRNRRQRCRMYSQHQVHFKDKGYFLQVPIFYTSHQRDTNSNIIVVNVFDRKCEHCSESYSSKPAIPVSWLDYNNLVFLSFTKAKIEGRGTGI